MKYYKKIFVVFFFPFIFSCSNNQNSEIVYFNEKTLRDISNQKDQSTLWTKELEAVRLFENIETHQSVSESVNLSPFTVAVLNNSNKLLYPDLHGFGNLDTSLLSKEVKLFLDDFCNSVFKWELSKIKIEKDSEIYLVFFKYDIENLWKEKFDSEFPVKLKTDEKKSRNAEKKISENNKENTKEADKNSDLKTKEINNEQPAEKKLIFNSKLYGKPFINEDEIEIPIRLKNQYGFLDIDVFISKNNGLSITKIQIKKWKKNNES